MTVHRVDFLYTRRVSIFVEAETEEELDDWLLTEGSEWHPVEHAPEMIEYDVSESDGDYAIEDAGQTRVANYVLTTEGIVEK